MSAIHFPNSYQHIFGRIEQPELLDLGLGSPRDVDENLAEMQRINDLLGGTRALTRHLFPRLLLLSQPVTLLDLGTGGAGIPMLILRWARNLRLPLRVLGVDWSARNLHYARRDPDILLVQTDALHLPLPSGYVDYVISTLFLHHLTPEQVIQLLRASFDLSRHGIIMSDLVRGWLPYLAFKLVQPLFARNYLTRHDGALSIRRSYTPQELRRLAARAGLPSPCVYVHFPWRMTLVVEK